jgi:hypothetical protein
MHEVNVLDFLPVEAGAFYVMDRGYLDFAWLFKMHQAGAFFVTCAKRGMDARRVYSAPTVRSTGVICDQTIALNGFYISKNYSELMRRIRFKDPESGKTLVFLTNNTSLPPLAIAALYKNRWQVELFFDCLSYCAPSYVIEYQGPSGPRCEVTGLTQTWWLGIHRDRPGELSTVHCDRLAWPLRPSVGSGATRMYGRAAIWPRLHPLSILCVPGARPHGTARYRACFGLNIPWAPSMFVHGPFDAPVD